MIKIMAIGSSIMLIIFNAAGCGEKTDPLSSLVSGESTITYVREIKTILDQHCLPCHSTSKSGAQRNGAPITINFDTYELAVANIERANTRIQAGTMPPTGGLDTEIRTTVMDWLATGTPRGEL